MSSAEESSSSESGSVLVGIWCPPPSPMTTLAYAAVILLVVLIVYWFVRQSRSQELSKALERKGWTLYTKEGCGWCRKQLEALGGCYGKKIVCDGGAADASHGCGGVDAFPHWVNARTGETRTGYQSDKELRGMV